MAGQTLRASDLDGLQKAAVLLIALGPEKSSMIFKHLREDEIEQLTLEIANTRSVSSQVKEEILNEFYQVCLAQQYIAEGGINYAKELLEKAGGDTAKVPALEAIEADIEERDYRDMHRENSPLRQAEDAHLVDSSEMTIEEVVATIMEIAEKS